MIKTGKKKERKKERKGWGNIMKCKIEKEEENSFLTRKKTL